MTNAATSRPPVASSPNGLRVERREHVAYLTIDRPERRNALSIGLTSELVSSLVDLGADDDIWAIILTGSGDEAFCAGTDLKELDQLVRVEGGQLPRPMGGTERNLFEVLLEVGKPTVAVVNGAAMGAGSELALACDMRVLATHAVLAQPEAKRGMGANFASVILPRLLPRAVAFELLYTGRAVSAAEALSLGLANLVADRVDLPLQAEDFVRSIVANAPLTLRRYKQMMTKSWGSPIHNALRLDAGPDPYGSRDREEGIRAFVEKRPPRWENR
jgi:enoyl-CoA hydratase